MLLRLAQALARHFGWTVSTALALGLLWPELARATTSSLFVALMGLFALSFTITDVGSMRVELRDARKAIARLVFLIALRPAVAYFAARAALAAAGLPDSWALAALLLYACPPAGVAPTLALLFEARFERALFATSVTTLLAPLTLPAVLWALGGDAMRVDLSSLTTNLVALILVPLALVLIARRVQPRLAEAVRPYAPGVATALLFVILLGAVGAGLGEGAGESSPLRSAFWRPLGQPLALMAALFMVVSAAGWIAAGLPGRVERKDRLNLALLCAWPNIGMALALGAQLFEGTTVGEGRSLMALLLASELVWALALGPARAWARRSAARDQASPVDGSSGSSRS